MYVPEQLDDVMLGAIQLGIYVCTVHNVGETEAIGRVDLHFRFRN